MATVQVIGNPQPTTVIDPTTGNAVPGYVINVRDPNTGARAQIDVPRAQLTTKYVHELANYELTQLNNVMAIGSSPAAPQG